ncbi:MAG: ATP-binding protein [Anaerolineae bacterium]|nr:ATP-binding protein [Anaerolineae bacterium]
MRLVFDTCIPRFEVRQGELSEDIFAARLKDVMDGTAPDVYQHPQVFFENTFPTEGLRVLLNEVLGRLTGARPSNSPVIRLETAFGGGKTHNLIALYHAARGAVPPAQMTALVAADLRPEPGQVDIAGVVGSDLVPESGLYHPADDVRVYTLWGELAYQLRGLDGYALVRESDLHKSAPGTGLFEELIGDRPTLMMLDEIARHMRAAQSVPTVTGKSDLAEQTVAFLMSLFEFAASKARVVVVFTLAGVGDAFAKETEHLREQLAEVHKVSARQEQVITPTGETEVAAIVRHRLFEHIDATAAAETAQVYAAAYQKWHAQNVALPARALSAGYAQALAAAYPFHPELLNALTLRIATIPNFQKTRGALRLLALVVRRLWELHPADASLIAPYHIDVQSAKIVEDLTSRLNRPAFKQVIEADIACSKGAAPGHAHQIDEMWVASGKPPYARRVALTAFLHSLVQGTVSGIDPADLLLAVLSPGDEPLLVYQAAERLYDRGWFFEWDGLRYRFKPEPSINKIINDEMEMIGRTVAKQELDARIRKVWKTGTFKVVTFPQEASQVEDDADAPRLVILHYDAASVTVTDPQPPDMAVKIAERAGTLEGYRRFRNSVLFLVADGERVGEMVQTAQRYLAIQRITGNAQRMAEFTPEQQKKLKKLGEAAELDVRVAITKVYRHFYFPQTDVAQRVGNLAHNLLPAQEQGQVPQDQSTVLLHVLRQQQKALTGNDPMLASAYVKSRAWDTHQVQLTTDELRQAFARRLSLPLLFDLNQLKKTILNGIQTGVWVYYDARAEVGYDAESPPPAVQIIDEVYLYLPEEAARLGFAIKGKEKSPGGGGGTGGTKPVETCPVCGQPADQCTCGEDGGWTPPPKKEPLYGEGVPHQAFQQVLDRCADQQIAHLAALRITLQGQGKAGAQDLRVLGVIIPQLNVPNLRVQLTNYAASFGVDEYITATADLSWERYRQLKQATDELSKTAAEFSGKITLILPFPDGLAVNGDTFRALHEVMTTVGLGPIRVEGEVV